MSCRRLVFDTGPLSSFAAVARLDLLEAVCAGHAAWPLSVRGRHARPAGAGSPLGAGSSGGRLGRLSRDAGRRAAARTRQPRPIRQRIGGSPPRDHPDRANASWSAPAPIGADSRSGPLPHEQSTRKAASATGIAARRPRAPSWRRRQPLVDPRLVAAPDQAGQCLLDVGHGLGEWRSGLLAGTLAVDRARWGASGALYPQTAPAGLNPCPRVRVRRSAPSTEC
jgi:hypothetical protein